MKNSEEFKAELQSALNGLCRYLGVFGLKETVRMTQRRRQEILKKKPKSVRMNARVSAYTEFLSRHKKQINN